MIRGIGGMRRGLGLAAFGAALLVLPVLMSNLALAAEPWQIYFDEANSPIMEGIREFNYYVQIIIFLIVILVVVLLAWVMFRYSARRNPVPSKTSHNTVVEVLWTIVPVLILVGIAIPSFALLFEQYDPSRVVADYDPSKTVTVKITGQANWNWSYEYPDLGVAEYYSRPLEDEELQPGQPRLLAVDLPMVVPVGTVVRIQVTADPKGMIHAFALPEMGVKLDAVPGRMGEMWFLAEREGTFYGQCSELCGPLHYKMPIELRVVNRQQFDTWVAAAAEDPYSAVDLLAKWEDERHASEAAQVASR